ncbi:MAG: PAS domain S-box protein [Longimicrobiales bacterium]
MAVDLPRDALAEGPAAAEQVRFQAQLLNAVREAVIATDTQGVVTYWNKAAERLYGWSAAEVMGRRFIDLLPTNMHTPEAQYVFEKLSRGEDWTGDFPARRKDGTIFPAGASATAIRSPDGTQTGIIGISNDLTERIAIEAQLRESHKLEAVGRLAGGIAHDFNNLLTVIQGNAQELLQNGSEQVRNNVAEIEAAALRAADLTRQLLAFSRQQVLQPRIVSLGGIVHDMQGMLQRLVRADIQLTVSTAAELGMVRADPAQLSRVVMNLVANARDAISGAGNIAISVENVDVPPNEEGFITRLKPGPHVLLTVTDSGAGMDQHTLDHIFEPFFTTKGAEQGTGLGLPTVFGIVTQSGGHITAESTFGKGSTFRVFVPRVAGDVEHATPSAQAPIVALSADRDGGVVVLLCEDEDAVRRIVRTSLHRKGYRVMEAASGAEALQIADSFVGTIDLLLSDVVMPEMSGTELMRELLQRRPNVKVLLMSGYASPDALGETTFEVDVPFLEKPFTVTALAAKVHEVLAAPSRG